MNKEQFKKELDMKLASLKEEMMQKFEEEQEDEFPKNGDKYYYLTTRGNIEHATWRDDEFDSDLLEIGNISPTEDEMEFNRERLRVIKELEKFAEPKDREWDGENMHHYIMCDYSRGNNINYYNHSVLKHADIYFESIEKAVEAVRAVGEDRVKRFYLCIKD